MTSTSTRVGIILLFALVCVVLPASVTAQTTGTTYYVAQGTNASDSNAGTASAPLKTINAAVARAAAGDTIIVGAGVYAEAVSIGTNDGTANQPITLRADGAVTLQPTSGKPLIIMRSYWIVSGFAITPNGQNVAGVVFRAPANHSMLRDSHVYNGTYHGVLLEDGTSDNQVLNNEIDHFGLATSSSDAHGVAIHESHNNLISGNHIHHNMGDSVQVFSIDSQELYGRSANGNRIINNTMHDDRENAVDIKSSKNTLVEGNHMSGYRPSGTSDGMAIEVHYNSQDVVIANNEISDSNWGIEVSRGAKGGSPYPAAPQRVTIRNNYIHNIVVVGNGNSGDGAGIVVRESANVSVWNNTIRDAAGTCLVVTWSDTARPTNLGLKNNSTGTCGVADLLMKDTTPSDFQIDYNHYDERSGGRLKKGSKVYTLAAWASATTFDSHSITANPALESDGHLPSGSPLIDRGVDVGLPFCGAAPDLGAFEAACGSTPATATPVPPQATATATAAATASPSPTVTSSPTQTPTKTPKPATATTTVTPTKTPKPATATTTVTPTKTPKPATATTTVTPTKTPKAAASTATVTPTKTSKTSAPSKTMTPTKTAKPSKTSTPSRTITPIT